MDNLPPELFTLFALFIVFLVLVLAVPSILSEFFGIGTKGSFKRIKEAFLEAAERTELEFHPRDMVQSSKIQERESGLKGVHRGRQVEVASFTEIRESSRRNHFETFHSHADVEVKLSDELWAQGVKIEPRSRGQKLEQKILGDVARLDKVKDVLTGNREFDEDFLVSGMVGDEMLTMLREPALQQTLSELAAKYKGFKVKLGKVVLELPTTPKDADGLIAAVDRAIDAADQLDGAIDEACKANATAKGAEATEEVEEAENEPLFPDF